MASYAKKAFRRLEQDFQRYKREGANKKAAPSFQLTAKLVGVSQVSRMVTYANADRSTCAVAVVYRDGSSINFQVYDGRSEIANVMHFKGSEALEVAESFARFAGIPRV